MIISILVETFGKTWILSFFFRQEICHSFHWIKNETNLNLEWLIVLFDEIRVLVSLRMFLIPDKAFLESFEGKQTFYTRISISALCYYYYRVTQHISKLFLHFLIPSFSGITAYIYAFLRTWDEHWIQFQLQQRRWERRLLGYGLLV